jgi:hypothetical protein
MRRSTSRIQRMVVEPNKGEKKAMMVKKGAFIT